MSSLKTKIFTAVARGIYTLWPRSLRLAAVNLMIQAEEYAPPRDAVRSLLGFYDALTYAIDRQCKLWGGGVHIKHELMDGIHSFFYERIPADSRVLDLGCGQGVVANAIAEHSESEVVGIDMDASQIAFAKTRYRNPRLHFIIGNVFTDIPQSESFDVIVLSSVLEHLENRGEFLKNLIVRYHPRKFLIRVPTFEQHHFKALKRELGLFAYADSTHVLEYSPQSFAEEMEQAGMQIEHLEIRWGDIWAECVPSAE